MDPQHSRPAGSHTAPPCSAPTSPTAVPSGHPDQKHALETTASDANPRPPMMTRIDIEAPLATLSKTTSTAPYSIYTSRQKAFIVTMSSVGGFLSPLCASSILPALQVLSRDYSTSISAINLSVTAFMIFQAITPSVTGDIADMAGRRPAYLASCVLILAANIGLALQSNLAAFYALRCLQSAGSSAMSSLNSGIVADISTTAERGRYMGAAQAGIMLGPALAPVIGGILTKYLGWRAIFWFLLIVAGLYFAVFAVFIPETARKIVGNGSRPPTIWFNKSVLSYLARRREEESWTAEEAAAKRQEAQALAAKIHLRLPNPFTALRIILERDCACIMFTTGMVYAGWYTVTTTLATSLQRIYGMDTVHAGLCYLPFGGGAALAVFANGRILDWNYARTCKALGVTMDRRRGDDLASFPIERARLDLVWPQLYVGCAALISYGWALHAETHVAAPLILTFLIGTFMTTTYNSLNILLVDLYPNSPSTAAAANNLTRCLMGAGSSAVIEPMVLRMGLGWAFTLVGLLVVLISPMMYVVRRWGPVWREERRLRIQENKTLKEVS